MIVYPKKWQLEYCNLYTYENNNNVDILKIINMLEDILIAINIRHIAYSGGVDSTIILCLMSQLFDNISTYTISCRKDHPDVKFASIGSKLYKSNHHEFIIGEEYKQDGDRDFGDNAVRRFFELSSKYIDKIICCDGIDEFMCGYYKHQDESEDTYRYYLSRLTPDYLVPLNKNSKNIKVFLPYLNKNLLDLIGIIPLNKKVDGTNRKKIIMKIADYLNIPKEISRRNKYGFCDAFIEKNK